MLQALLHYKHIIIICKIQTLSDFSELDTAKCVGLTAKKSC